MNKPLKGRTLLMSGGSRGIGLAIARTVARQGANVALLAEAGEPDSALRTAAAVLEAAGGQALTVRASSVSEESVRDAVGATTDRFGGIDIVVHSAAVSSVSDSEQPSDSDLERNHQIRLRGAVVLTHAALPHLRRSDNPHILSLSPPLTMAANGQAPYPPSAVDKLGMTLLTLGFASELRNEGIAANCLWPHSAIADTAARNLLGGEKAIEVEYERELVGDAAALILANLAATTTGNTFVDVDVLAEYGITDLSGYASSSALVRDFLVGSAE
ncbi:SDR family oxidoreductase [Nocardia salmonicida]|uniref:SDR family oxidoreductase n=1 Tax=Nocardia salmonicida TaxID=53431 RepID=UPI0033E11E06